MFNCRHKSKFRLSWMGATEVPTPDKSNDIDFLRFLLEIITFISVITRIIWGGIYIEMEILGTLDINSKLGFLNSGAVNSLSPFLG